MLKYKAGVLNRVSDALSWHSGLLTTMHTEIVGFDSFKDLVTNDPFFSHILEEVKEGKQCDYHVYDSFPFKGSQLCVPDSRLRMQII